VKDDSRHATSSPGQPRRACLVIVSGSDIEAELRDTALWRPDVERVFCKRPRETVDAVRASRPRLVVLHDENVERSDRLIRRLRSDPETRTAGIFVLRRTQRGSHLRLRRAGANVVATLPLDPEVWNARIEELLSVPPRRQTRIPARVRTWPPQPDRPQAIEAQSVNLGITGCLLETVQPLPIGTKLDLQLRLAPSTDDHVEVVGQAVRRAGTAGELTLTGIRFLVLRGDAGKHISAFVAAGEDGVADGWVEEPHAWESELRESETRKSAMLAASPDGIFTIDQEGRVIECNPATGRIFGLPIDEILGRNVEETLFPPDTWQLEGDGLLDALGRGTWPEGRVRTMARRTDGGAFPVELAVRAIPLDRKRLFTAYVRDVSARERMESEQQLLHMALVRAAREWETTFDAIASPLLIMEAGGRIRRMNRAACAAAGEDCVGRPVADVAPGAPWETLARLAEQAMTTQRSASEHVHDAASGHTWDVTLSPFRSGASDEALAVGVARDVTDLAKLQASLRKTETMAAIGSMLAEVAHEVRNPLHVLGAIVDAFAHAPPDTAEHQRFIDTLRLQLGRLSDLMWELLDYGRPVAVELVNRPVAPLLRHAIRDCHNLAEATRVEVVQELEDDLPAVAVSAPRLEQVFRNLIENAIHHSPPGGCVTVRVRRGRVGGVECSVQDAGPGFRDEDLPRVFEPFFTRRHGGTGLGLALAQRIVQQHGGTLGAENAAQGGAVLRVELPAASSDPVDSAQPLG